MNTGKEYDVIVVGTGAGGCTVAREMALSGKRVLMLEKGGRWDRMGNSLAIMMGLANMGVNMSREGHFVTIPNNYGGLSNFTAGCATPPAKLVWDPVGIDLSEEAEEAKKEMKVQIMPDEICGDQNLRLLEIANDIGFNWKKMEKFIEPEKCVDNCSNTMNGDKYGAKWTARRYGDEAMEHGAELKLRRRVTKVIVENGKAVGVTARHAGKDETYHGKTIVLSGGLFNVYLLRDAGIQEAGQTFTCDWLEFIGAKIPGLKNKGMNPMAVGDLSYYESDGLVILPVFPGWFLFTGLAAVMGPKAWSKIMNFRNYTGIMVKIRDDAEGEIYKKFRKGIPNFSKPITHQDRMRLDKGYDIIKKIFQKAGADESSMLRLNPLGAHPSSTCSVGKVVDTDLQTRIPNLYCCDASVTPSALGTPVVWTVVSLGKRLAKHLNERN